MKARLAAGAGGVAIGAFGVYQLLALGASNLIATVVWLAGGVLLHDGVLAFATIAIVGAGTLLLPERVKGPTAAAFLVLGTVTPQRSTGAAALRGPRRQPDLAGPQLPPRLGRVAGGRRHRDHGCGAFQRSVQAPPDPGAK